MAVGGCHVGRLGAIQGGFLEEADARQGGREGPSSSWCRWKPGSAGAPLNSRCLCECASAT